MSWGAAMLASLLIVLPRPGAWIIALAAFLVRGGVLLFLLPIVVLPSPVGLATMLGPTITAFWLGGMSLGLAAVVAAIFATFFVWLVVGGWVAALTERDLIRLVAADDEMAGVARLPKGSAARREGRVWRIVILRLAAHVPLALALGYGAYRLVQATYRELTLPSDVLVPIAWRVLAATPDVVLAIAATWVLGEILGSLGARRLILWGQSIDRAYAGAWADLARRPATSLATWLAPTLALALVAGPIVLASSVAWDSLRIVLTDQRSEDLPVIVLTMVAFVAVWSAGLLVAGVLAAWRSSAWTVEVLRGRGTFGASGATRPGEWKGAGSSGSL